MEFRKQQPIYRQIGDYICENIVNRKWTAGEKIPSVRDMAVSVEVNPNTVMRTYTDLQEKDIIYNQRGIGFFVSPKAVENILHQKKIAFLENDLPRMFKTMRLLDMDMDDLHSLYQTYCRKDDHENK